MESMLAEKTEYSVRVNSGNLQRRPDVDSTTAGEAESEEKAIGSLLFVRNIE